MRIFSQHFFILKTEIGPRIIMVSYLILFGLYSRILKIIIKNNKKVFKNLDFGIIIDMIYI